MTDPSLLQTSPVLSTSCCPGHIRDFLVNTGVGETPGALLQRMVGAGLDQLPLPGRGATLCRWRNLASVAGQNLSLVKLFEAHTDALAIIAELDSLVLSELCVDRSGKNLHEQGRAAVSTWGVWCAEIPGTTVTIEAGAGSNSRVVISGLKHWCSGAAALSHGLVSAVDQLGNPWLVAVAMAQAGVEVLPDRWQAVGMADTQTSSVKFDQAKAICVGNKGDYVRRPGFWHGGIGIAACWYGAAVQIAQTLRDKIGNFNQGRPAVDAHQLAHLGAIDMALSSARAYLTHCAAAIDAAPQADARVLAYRARLLVESACVEVMRHTGEAMGAAPFCQDRRFAHLMADLPVFLRQSHGQRDRAALGSMITDDEQLSPHGEYGWSL